MYKCYEGLISKIQSELLQFSNKKMDNSLKNWANIKTDFMKENINSQ